MSTRWARTALCTLAVAATSIFGMVGAAATGTRARPVAAPPLSLVSQTPWVTPTQPWFNIALGVGSVAGPVNTLHVSLIFYSRVIDRSQFEQAAGAFPQKSILTRVPDVTVAPSAAGGVAAACVTVLPDDSASAPASGAGACPAGSPTVLLGCTPDTASCGDVYPVSVALIRQGSTTPVAHFTTFLTYQEPQGPVGADGPLRVGVIAPVAGAGATTMAAALAAHRNVPVTLAVVPRTIAALQASHTGNGDRALAQLSDLADDQVLTESYVPINVAALSEAGIAGEIDAQLARGTELLRSAGLRPAAGLWVDTASNLAEGDAGDLASGLQVAGATQLVLSDNDLASTGSSSLTFAQPFTLDLGHGNAVAAAASNSNLSALFDSSPSDPVLGAQQLLAGLSFVHFENTFKTDHRGVVVSPPPDWRPSDAFMDTLLSGLTQNPALTPVTLSQFSSEVPVGGNGEPSTLRLQAGPAGHGITRTAAQRIATACQQLSSWCCGSTAAVDGHPPGLTALADELLATEASGLGPRRRSAALTAYDRAFAEQTGTITLATERTVTFTAQQAAIPVTVLSGSSYPVTVIVTLTSDKFTFPDGNSRQLVLDRPTTSVRVTAHARTSGDRLPIDVTLHTPDGQLVLARAVLTVQSTAISFVGVALTVLAGAVLLAWWVRTWLRARRARPRAR